MLDLRPSDRKVPGEVELGRTGHRHPVLNQHMKQGVDVHRETVGAEAPPMLRCDLGN